MFDNLSESLQRVFHNIRGRGKLSEDNIKDALREVRLALLEADVNYEVVKDFIAKVKARCLGEEVLTSIKPGQQVVKFVHDEMINLLGKQHHTFNLSGHPSMIMMLGLHGAGKTTTTGKLARKWKAEGKKVLLAACDIRRPAAVDQLRILAEQEGVDIVTPNPGETVPEIGLRARNRAMLEGHHIIIFDTGGRFQIDEDLVAELKVLKQSVKPQNMVLVIDAAIGQESVAVAKTFNEALGLTGLILTKMDGDARGGAALSVQAVTGCPILLIGTGEQAEDLEAFHPDRMASRILGMGDVVTLVEKAQTVIDEKDAIKFEQKLRKNTFNLEDFLSQMQMMKKMGPLEGMLDMLPGMPQIDKSQKQKMAETSAREFKKNSAIIQSMTPKERRNPKILNASRRKRIAQGSGTDVRDVNQLIKNFGQAQKMAKRMKKSQKRLIGRRK